MFETNEKQLAKKLARAKKGTSVGRGHPVEQYTDAEFMSGIHPACASSGIKSLAPVLGHLALGGFGGSSSGHVTFSRRWQVLDSTQGQHGILRNFLSSVCFGGNAEQRHCLLVCHPFCVVIQLITDTDVGADA